MDAGWVDETKPLHEQERCAYCGEWLNGKLLVYSGKACCLACYDRKTWIELGD
jgi:formylmethanofuran dehydrogenase subunit E